MIALASQLEINVSNIGLTVLFANIYSSIM